MKVLIADDEPKIRRGLAGAIEWDTLGMELCGFAKNGEEALQKMKEYCPEICLEIGRASCRERV